MSLTKAMKVHPKNVPFSVKEGNNIIWRRETLVNGDTDIERLKLFRQNEQGHALASAKFLVGHKAVEKLLLDVKIINFTSKDRKP